MNLKKYWELLNVNNKLFVGIDPSLTHTGVFFICGDWNLGLQIDTKRNQFNCSIARCQFIANTIIQLIQEQKQQGKQLAMICSEDYFVGRNQTAVIPLCQLGTMIRYKILQQGYPFCVTTPSQLKKFVTTKGNAPKQLVIKCAKQRWNYKLPTDNIADASGLANFGKKVYQIIKTPDDVQILKYQRQIFLMYKDENCLMKL